MLVYSRLMRVIVYSSYAGEIERVFDRQQHLIRTNRYTEIIKRKL